jgi:hypothetical protein
VHKAQDTGRRGDVESVKQLKSVWPNVEVSLDRRTGLAGEVLAYAKSRCRLLPVAPGFTLCLRNSLARRVAGLLGLF